MDLGFDGIFHEGSQSCCDQHAWGFTSDCGALHNPFASLAASGSNLAPPRGLEGYGPQRRRSPLKVFGGSLPPGDPDPSGPGEALSSSISERALTGSATFRTSPGLTLAQVLVAAMEDEPSSDLNQGQLFFYDLCQQDLRASSEQYRLTGQPHHGQQVLADLRRMQNIIHRHLNLLSDARSPLANVYVISQVLTTILLNPDGQNLCFGNAPFRCWCWTGAFADDSAQAWGHTQNAVRRCLMESQGLLLVHDPDLQPIWDHFPQGSQADAADFAGFLWARAESPFYGGKFFHRKLQGSLDEQFPLNLLFPAGEASASLEELISGWAAEEGGQFLYGAPDALVIQLQRFQMIDDVWTKHDRALDFSLEVNFPFSEDGHHVHTAAYRIVALVTHQGVDHHTGHYQSLLLMDKAVWLADDGQYPVPKG